jgi:hypothetical protein
MCRESNCEVPGIASDVMTNLDLVTSNFKTKLKKINEKLRGEYNTNQWIYANYSNRNWMTISTPKKLSTIAASNTRVWGVDINGGTSDRNGKIWNIDPIAPGGMKQVAVCPDRLVYGVNSEGKIFERGFFGKWIKLPGIILSTIACGNDGVNTKSALYGVNSSGSIFTYRNSHLKSDKYATIIIADSDRKLSQAVRICNNNCGVICRF